MWICAEVPLPDRYLLHREVTIRQKKVTRFFLFMVLFRSDTVFCIAENASVTGNFAPKNEAYEKRKIQGVALPEKERFG